MTIQASDVSVRRTIVVNASQEKAFDVFVNRIGSWWPQSHHLLEVGNPVTILEPRAGGRWYERSEDGTECGNGTVLVFEPPSRLVLDWQIDGSWNYDAAFHSEVEVRFIAEHADRTRVELEHRGLEAYGEKLGAVRDAISSENGWALGLRQFAEACN